MFNRLGYFKISYNEMLYFLWCQILIHLLSYGTNTIFYTPFFISTLISSHFFLGLIQRFGMDNPAAVNSANRRLSHLPPALKNHIRSGVALPSIARCVEELVRFHQMLRSSVVVLYKMTSRTLIVHWPQKIWIFYMHCIMVLKDVPTLCPKQFEFNLQ